MENTIKTFTEQMQEIQNLANKSKVKAKALFDTKIAERVKKEKKRAETIISAIQINAQNAACDNQSGVTVMRLKCGEEEGFSDYLAKDIVKKQSKNSFNSPVTVNSLPVDKLGVCANEVFMYCKTTLAVTTYIKECITSYDERGITYYVIYISWKIS